MILNDKNLLKNEMNQKRQLGRGWGIFGLPILWTRGLYLLFFIIGVWFLVLAPTQSPFYFSWETLYSKEIGFFIFLIGVILYAAYK